MPVFPKSYWFWAPRPLGERAISFVDSGLALRKVLNPGGDEFSIIKCRLYNGQTNVPACCRLIGLQMSCICVHSYTYVALERFRSFDSFHSFSSYTARGA